MVFTRHISEALQSCPLLPPTLKETNLLNLEQDRIWPAAAVGMVPKWNGASNWEEVVDAPHHLFERESEFQASPTN